MAAFIGQYLTEMSASLAPKWLQELALQFVLVQTALIFQALVLAKHILPT